MTGFARQELALAALKTRNRYRRLEQRKGHDFSSNDYLGLAGSEFLRKAAQAALERGVPVGSSGSRLLRGNDDEHELLEKEAAAFFQVERSLFFGAGYLANTAIFSALPQQGDLVVYDELVHASAHDGMRLGRAERTCFAHNDPNAAEDAIRNWRRAGNTGQIWLACEGVYSMEGDLAPVEELAALADAHDCVLVVDEAHATGLFGDTGRGLTHQISDKLNVLTLHTCGKAMGVAGALVCGAASMIETLINRGRGFIFTTAPSPLNAALVRASLDEIQHNPARRQAAWALIRHAHQQAHEICGMEGFSSQILPVIVGDDQHTMDLAKRLQENGFDIRGVRPPTVSIGTSRLRLSITLNTSDEIVSQMLSLLAEEFKDVAR
jgi:8-amino-7-oxononanoate synthase